MMHDDLQAKTATATANGRLDLPSFPLPLDSHFPVQVPVKIVTSRLGKN